MTDNIQPLVNPYAQLYGKRTSTGSSRNADASQTGYVAHVSSASYQMLPGSLGHTIEHATVQQGRSSVVQEQQCSRPCQMHTPQLANAGQLPTFQAEQHCHTAPHNSDGSSSRDAPQFAAPRRKRRFSEQPPGGSTGPDQSSALANDSSMRAVNQSSDQNGQQHRSATADDSCHTEEPANCSQKGDVVLIWDLDETLILFHSLVDGRYAAAHNIEV